MLCPAFVHSDAGGSGSGFFPDARGCYFAVGSLEEVFRDAQSALDAHFEMLSELEQPIPLPIPVEQHLVQKPQEFVDGR